MTILFQAWGIGFKPFSHKHLKFIFIFFNLQKQSHIEIK